MLSVPYFPLFTACLADAEAAGATTDTAGAAGYARSVDSIVLPPAVESGGPEVIISLPSQRGELSRRTRYLRKSVHLSTAVLISWLFPGHIVRVSAKCLSDSAY